MEAVLREYGEEVAEKMVRLAGMKLGKDEQKSSRIKHVVDKMLFNYRNIGITAALLSNIRLHLMSGVRVLESGFIHLVYPDALIIHTVRDPLDTLFSCYRNKFDDAGLEWSLDVPDLVLQYAVYLEIMQHFREVLPGRVLDLR